jgi:hypothetical protein
MVDNLLMVGRKLKKKKTNASFKGKGKAASNYKI